VRRKIDGYGLAAHIEPALLFPTVEEFRARTPSGLRSCPPLGFAATPPVATTGSGRPAVVL
jgi:hypothetical protein